ncbi:dipeptide ABC transporter ATP-binding protein [Kineococcus radiotolerans]|uniref:ABC transporter related n=1 Tax=Kineococcus radiotolerans (strain ATCC BAA-149 / DSM 14245 / SRS30216) TaxID=266940 RepID=A6W727_KINRD|nr:ABC transporter ATP-binding protein [Kineococcus radiotolerans]ABS02616.1 ABC transporter related [Kineococcus radiotolerans SRS30216 = ATCC BAA-149]
MSHPTSAAPSPAARPAAAPVDRNKPLLQVEDLQVDFRSGGRTVHAVRGASFTVYPGQTVAIVGESGSGKSTSAMAVIGLLPGTGTVAGGRILFDGRDIAHASKRDYVALRGNHIGLVPQDPMSNLNPVWNIGFQVKEAIEANGLAKGAEAKRRAIEVLGEAGLGDAARRYKQYPHEFSGGMRQRALIGIGLASRPRLLIADEPTSALDVTVQRGILDHLESLTDELGTAVLLITHDLGLAAERAEHLVVMYKGQVVESGPALQILKAPRHPYTQRLVSAAPSLASRRMQSQHRAQVVEQAEAHALRAHEIVAAETPVAVPDVVTPEVIEVQNLTKEFVIRGAGPRGEKLLAVDDVSFSVKRGTTLAVVGESGSGKSTVAQMVLNLLPATKGRVLFDGVDTTTLNREQSFAFRRRVQPIFQNPYGSLDPSWSIFRSIEEPLRVHAVGDAKSREARVRDLLDKVSLPQSSLRRFPNELSGGQRQRVAIARALALQPEVVVCDEAVSALDVLVQGQILRLLNDLQAELGLTYLFITHDLAVVREIADDVVVMQKGRLVEHASVDEVFENPAQEYTRALLEAIPGGSIELGA